MSLRHQMYSRALTAVKHRVSIAIAADPLVHIGANHSYSPLIRVADVAYQDPLATVTFDA